MTVNHRNQFSPLTPQGSTFVPIQATRVCPGVSSAGCFSCFFGLLPCFGKSQIFIPPKRHVHRLSRSHSETKKNAKKLFRYICRVNQGLSNALFGLSGGWCVAAMWAGVVHERVLEWFHHSRGRADCAVCTILYPYHSNWTIAPRVAVVGFDVCGIFWIVCFALLPCKLWEHACLCNFVTFSKWLTSVRSK